MSLIMTGSRDQALLATVVREAHASVTKSGGYVGRTALQKIMYFLQVSGIPMNYRFDIYHYGPFCEEILRDIDWLTADQVVIDRSDNPQRYSNYAPGENSDELIQMHQSFLAPLRNKIDALVRAFIPLKPRTMELIATLDYLYRQQKATTSSGPWKPSVISRFDQVKAGKFLPEEINEAYDGMVRMGLIEA